MVKNIFVLNLLHLQLDFHFIFMPHFGKYGFVQGEKGKLFSKRIVTVCWFYTTRLFSALLLAFAIWQIKNL